MKNKFQLLLILLVINVLSFPSLCFSEMKTATGEYCKIYLGDMEDKYVLNHFRNIVRDRSIEDGLRKLDKNNHEFQSSISKIASSRHCIRYISNQYLNKVVVVSHTEKNRKICDKVKITVDTEIIYEFIKMDGCPPLVEAPDAKGEEWVEDIYSRLELKGDVINIGLIIDTKIPDIEGNKKELLENEEEKQLFFVMSEIKKDKYKVVDRRHLSKIIDEQKLSSSGLTDSDSVKLGKLLNLDIIVLRLIYENSQVTKVLKVDTGEVLLFKTYELEKKTKKEEWVPIVRTHYRDTYYYNSSITNVRPNVVKVWVMVEYSKIGKDEYIKERKKDNLSVNGYEMLVHQKYLSEYDCVNKTVKTVKSVDYDNKGYKLEDQDYSYINQIIPGTVADSVLKNVCPK